jgi:hypothetical protein
MGKYSDWSSDEEVDASDEQQDCPNPSRLDNENHQQDYDVEQEHDMAVSTIAYSYCGSFLTQPESTTREDDVSMRDSSRGSSITGGSVVSTSSSTSGSFTGTTVRDGNLPRRLNFDATDDNVRNSEDLNLEGTRDDDHNSMTHRSTSDEHLGETSDDPDTTAGTSTQARDRNSDFRIPPTVAADGEDFPVQANIVGDCDSAVVTGNSLSEVAGKISVPGSSWTIDNKLLIFSANTNSHVKIKTNKHFCPSTSSGTIRESIPISEFRSVKLAVLSSSFGTRFYLHMYMLNEDTIGKKGFEGYQIGVLVAAMNVARRCPHQFQSYKRLGWQEKVDLDMNLEGTYNFQNGLGDHDRSTPPAKLSGANGYVYLSIVQDALKYIAETPVRRSFFPYTKHTWHGTEGTTASILNGKKMSKTAQELCFQCFFSAQSAGFKEYFTPKEKWRGYLHNHRLVNRKCNEMTTKLLKRCNDELFQPLPHLEDTGRNDKCLVAVDVGLTFKHPHKNFSLLINGYEAEKFVKEIVKVKKEDVEEQQYEDVFPDLPLPRESANRRNSSSPPILHSDDGSGTDIEIELEEEDEQHEQLEWRMDVEADELVRVMDGDQVDPLPDAREEDESEFDGEEYEDFMVDHDQSWRYVQDKYPERIGLGIVAAQEEPLVEFGPEPEDILDAASEDGEDGNDRVPEDEDYDPSAAYMRYTTKTVSYPQLGTGGIIGNGQIRKDTLRVDAYWHETVRHGLMVKMEIKESKFSEDHCVIQSKCYAGHTRFFYQKQIQTRFYQQMNQARFWVLAILKGEDPTNEKLTKLSSWAKKAEKVLAIATEDFRYSQGTHARFEQTYILTSDSSGTLSYSLPFNNSDTCPSRTLLLCHQSDVYHNVKSLCALLLPPILTLAADPSAFNTPQKKTGVYAMTESLAAFLQIGPNGQGTMMKQILQEVGTLHHMVVPCQHRTQLSESDQFLTSLPWGVTPSLLPACLIDRTSSRDKQHKKYQREALYLPKQDKCRIPATFVETKHEMKHLLYEEYVRRDDDGPRGLLEDIPYQKVVDLPAEEIVDMIKGLSSLLLHLYREEHAHGLHTRLVKKFMFGVDGLNKSEACEKASRISSTFPVNSEILRALMADCIHLKVNEGRTKLVKTIGE